MINPVGVVALFDILWHVMDIFFHKVIYSLLKCKVNPFLLTNKSYNSPIDC